jgi:hypothetical protein
LGDLVSQGTEEGVPCGDGIDGLDPMGIDGLDQRFAVRHFSSRYGPLVSESDHSLFCSFGQQTAGGFEGLFDVCRWIAMEQASGFGLVWAD